MKTKEKIRYYIKKQGLSIYKFEKITGLSHGILKVGQDFQANKLKQIRDALPDLNMDWLIYDEGEMLLERNNMVSEPQGHYSNTGPLEKELALTKALLDSKDETIILLKERLAMYEAKKNTGS